MRGLINNSERQRTNDFLLQKRQFCIEFKDAMVKAKSPNMQVAQVAKEALGKMQRKLDGEQKTLLQIELREMEKRSRRTQRLAQKSADRRGDWIRHTLGVIENDVQRGGKKEIEQAQTIAKAFFFGAEPARESKLKAPQHIEPEVLSDSEYGCVDIERSTMGKQRFLTSTAIPHSSIERPAGGWKWKYAKHEPSRDPLGVHIRPKLDKARTARTHQQQIRDHKRQEQLSQRREKMSLETSPKRVSSIVSVPRVATSIMVLKKQADSLYDEDVPQTTDRSMIPVAKLVSPNVTFRDVNSKDYKDEIVEVDMQPIKYGQVNVRASDPNAHTATKATAKLRSSVESQPERFTRSKLSPRSLLQKERYFYAGGDVKLSTSRAAYSSVSRSLVVQSKQSDRSGIADCTDPFIEPANEFKSSRPFTPNNLSAMSMMEQEGIASEGKKLWRNPGLIFGKRRQNRAQRTALVNQLREKRMQANEPVSIRSHTHYQIKDILSQTWRPTEEQRPVVREKTKVQFGNQMRVASTRTVTANMPIIAMQNFERKQSNMQITKSKSSSQTVAYNNKRNSSNLNKVQQVTKRPTAKLSSSQLEQGNGEVTDRNELVQKFLENTMQNRKPFAGIMGGRRLSGMSSISSQSGLDPMNTGVKTPKNNFRSSFKTQPQAQHADDSKYSKKTYHISVRSKISPHILKLGNTHTDFDRGVNVRNRAQICSRLREESQLNLNAQDMHQHGDADSKGSGGLIMSNVSIDFSSDGGDDGLELEDDNQIDKAFKKLQKRKDQMIRFQKQRLERRNEKRVNMGLTAQKSEELDTMNADGTLKKGSSKALNLIFGKGKSEI